MKKLSLIFIFSLISFTMMAQKGSGFGITGGLNYNSNGDYYQSADIAAQHPDKNIGYHFGLFGKIGNKIFVRPEVVYTYTQSDYGNDTYNLSKLDAPVLLGVKIIGPVSVFAGPAFQYILEQDFEGVKIETIEKDFTVGTQFGVGVNLGKFGIDVRYERGMNENEATFVNNNITTLPSSRLDTRSDQVVLNFSLKF